MTAFRCHSTFSIQNRPLELFPKAHEVGCAIVVREPLANGFLTGKYDPGGSFETGDIRHNWPKDYVLARVLAAQKLKFLCKGNRTLAQSALRFVLNNELVAVVIAGMKTPEQAEENLAASDAPLLTEEELQQILTLQQKGFRN